MTNHQIMRKLEQLETLMVPKDQPKVEFILAFVKPADGDQPGNVKYCKFNAAGKRERVNPDGSPWKETSNDRPDLAPPGKDRGVDGS
jgi:hypothetical protein